MCVKCNVSLRSLNTFVPLIFHNFKCCDSHLVCQYGLKDKDSQYYVITQSEQKYITMTEKFRINIYTGADGEEHVKYTKLTSIDSFQHMSSSLGNLFSYLPPEDHQHVANPMLYPHVSDEVLLKKGIYPYDFIDEESKMVLPSLPAQADL